VHSRNVHASQVRNGLGGGGRWIRTIGTFEREAYFSRIIVNTSTIWRVNLTANRQWTEDRHAAIIALAQARPELSYKAIGAQFGVSGSCSRGSSNTSSIVGNARR
jgi:hypothetical protein